MSNVRVEVEDRTATVRIDRAEAGNRLDGATIDELRTALSELQDQPRPPAVVTLGAVGPDFSLGRQPAGDGPPTPAKLDREFARIQGLNELVQRYPAVIVASLQGQVRGAALSLAGRCDLVVAADDAQLSFPEVPDGIPPTIVLSHYRYVLAPKVLMDLILTGREISASEAITAGLVTRAVPGARLEEETRSLVDHLAAMDERTLRTVKRFMCETEGMDPRNAPAHGMSLFANEMVDRSLAAGA